VNIVIVAKSTLVHGLGGMETHLENLCRALADGGHRLDVITTRHPAALATEERSGARVHYLADAPSCRYSGAWWRASRECLSRLMAAGRIDLVLSESLAGAGIARMASRPPIYPFIHGLVLSHLAVEWSQRNGPGGAVRALGVTLPELLYYAYAHERPFLRTADGVIAIHDAQVRQLEGRCRRILLAYNGVDVAHFAPDRERRREVRRRLSIADSDRVVLLASLMTRQKGMHVGITAFARTAQRVSGARLVIAGDGPEAQRLRALAANVIPGGRTVFLGAIPNHEMPGYLNAADLFVHPSLRAEGLPTVVLEAMAAGLPIVATDAGGTSSAVADGETGLLVAKADVGALADAVERLLTDRPLAAKLATQALERARTRFAWPSIVGRLLADLGLRDGRTSSTRPR
jgi:glycosyltransferase involved in cell wall biosynthesis